MKDALVGLGCILVFIFAVVGLTWLAQGDDFFLHKYFDSKYEDVRRNTFEHSKAYNDSFRQELANMQFEYISASEEHKMALRSVILHQVNEYDETQLPADLRQFIADLRLQSHTEK